MILVLGGTKDSREIISLLNRMNLPVLVSTVSDYGAELAKSSGAGQVLTESFSYESLIQRISNGHVTTLIDATHPYAAEISKLAQQVSRELDIKYIRFERPPVKLEHEPLIFYASDINAAVEQMVNIVGKTIFLTTGSKQLHKYFSNHALKDKQVYVRVLPDPKVMQKCFDLGLTPKQIIAMQGPFSHELNKAIFKQLGIDVIVTKDSGKTGGTDTKISAALELGLKIIIIERPKYKLEDGNFYYIYTINQLKNLVEER